MLSILNMRYLLTEMINKRLIGKLNNTNIDSINTTFYMVFKKFLTQVDIFAAYVKDL